MIRTKKKPEAKSGCRKMIHKEYIAYAILVDDEVHGSMITDPNDVPELFASEVECWADIGEWVHGDPNALLENRPRPVKVKVTIEELTWASVTRRK